MLGFSAWIGPLVQTHSQVELMAKVGEMARKASRRVSLGCRKSDSQTAFGGEHPPPVNKRGLINAGDGQNLEIFKTPWNDSIPL